MRLRKKAVLNFVFAVWVLFSIEYHQYFLSQTDLTNFSFLLFYSLHQTPKNALKCAFFTLWRSCTDSSYLRSALRYRSCQYSTEDIVATSATSGIILRCSLFIKNKDWTMHFPLLTAYETQTLSWVTFVDFMGQANRLKSCHLFSEVPITL